MTATFQRMVLASRAVGGIVGQLAKLA